MARKKNEIQQTTQLSFQQQIQHESNCHAAILNFSIVSSVEFAMENASLLRKKLFDLQINHRSNIDSIISKYDKQGELELQRRLYCKLKNFVIPINTKEDIDLIKKFTANKNTYSKPKINIRAKKTRIFKQAVQAIKPLRRSSRQIAKKEKKSVSLTRL